MDNRIALDPRHSVVVEACAGSGKTWLLVSRIVRLLLAGAKPGEIIAITFTRKAAQEMQARLHEWLHLLAVRDDDEVKKFLRERALDDVDDALLAKARGLYRDFLLAQPSITISTFHGWFMQIIQRAPLNAGVPVGMRLLERTAALHEEAWQALADSLRDAPESETSQSMQWLFEKYGLHSTRSLLGNFVARRAEWWAYTSPFSPSPSDGTTSHSTRLANYASQAAGYPASVRGEYDSDVERAVEQLRIELDVDLDADPVAEASTDASLQAALQDFTRALATGTETQCNKAGEIRSAWEVTDARERFAALSLALYTKEDEPRSFKPTKKQNTEAFLLARDVLFDKLQAVRDTLSEQEVLRMNQAALRCGAALLEHYQELKLHTQQMDFTDLEWQVCRLLNRSDCAEYMQYKLDSRYRHVLLDEFQDTNPLQWQILQAWFAAAAAVDTRPAVFVVGDPKQSIYRFRRADARLFGEVREFLRQEFFAHYLTQNETRRNSPAVLEAVNGVFASEPDGFTDFEAHTAHHQELPGHIEVLEILPSDGTTSHSTRLSRIASQVAGYPAGGRGAGGEGRGDGIALRNPLTEPRPEEQSGAREIEAGQFAARIASIVAHWSVQEEDGTLRRAEYRDIMVLVRKRTHLRVYEHALRAHHIPFLTSRRGGLLDTLEAEDIQALLTFLITPFADLELAQALRSPLFACPDEDLMLLAGSENQDRGSGIGDREAGVEGLPRSSWWFRLQKIAATTAASPQLLRARRLLQKWLVLADKLPVHDLLDRIYFEGDLAHRYAAALPVELRETVRANLQAFMEIALNVDAGRYPSLPRFLAELRELRAAENESPDEGKVGGAGNALRIYTVHEAKGLEAPIVWLLDANDMQCKADSHNVLLDWPPDAPQPRHFSLYAGKRGRGVRRAHYFDAEDAYEKREEMNLLYVAMTRAKQALLVSGSGEPMETSWYGRIAAVSVRQENPLLAAAGSAAAAHENERSEFRQKIFAKVEPALLRPLPTGKCMACTTPEQRGGIWLHALLQHLAPPQMKASKAELQARCGIPVSEMDSLWQQAQHLLALPQLQRFFDPQHYRSACNEMPYANAAGELKRIDRLVEFDDEVWVLDYKTGAKPEVAPYRAQMLEYRDAMQSVYVGKKVRCALLFAEGTLCEVPQ